MTDLEQIHRAAHAQALKDNPVLAEALDAWKTDLMKAWEQSPARDAEGREKLYLMVHAAEKFKTYVEAMVDSGKLLTNHAVESAIQPPSRGWLNWLKP